MEKYHIAFALINDREEEIELSLSFNKGELVPVKGLAGEKANSLNLGFINFMTSFGYGKKISEKKSQNTISFTTNNKQEYGIKKVEDWILLVVPSGINIKKLCDFTDKLYSIVSDSENYELLKKLSKGEKLHDTLDKIPEIQNKLKELIEEYT